MFLSLNSDVDSFLHIFSLHGCNPFVCWEVCKAKGIQDPFHLGKELGRWSIDIFASWTCSS